MRLVDSTELARLLSVGRATDVLDEAFRTREHVQAPLRTHLHVGGGDLLLMPAAGAADAGVKIVTVNGRNPERGLPLIDAVYILFEPDTLRCAAVIDGPALTALRTSALSALASRYLAREDSTRLLLVGAGVQARAHLHAMRTVRPIREVRVLGRSPDHRDALVEEARDIGLVAGAGTAEDAGWADIICTCTTSSVPVVDGQMVRPGAHVNAVGAYRPDQRELDDVLLSRARVVVEERTVALAEAGDLALPIAAGVVAPDVVVADLHELVGGAVVRRDERDVTVFKSVGMAYEDLVVARAAIASGRG